MFEIFLVEWHRWRVAKLNHDIDRCLYAATRAGEGNLEDIPPERGSHLEMLVQLTNRRDSHLRKLGEPVVETS